MTYEQATSWLFDQFPAYQKIGVQAYKPDLSNTLMLCEILEITYSQLQFVHVAGTNGKGSTSNYLASIFQEAGYKTGLFTSPHIVDFRERIRINGIEIPEQRVIAFCEHIQLIQIPIAPSFFEITWALCLDYFLEQDCEICIIETGLGGRLDSTNIITPLLSIITNIGMDHQAILGDTLPQIALEKAGIIKTKVPVLIGETTAETKPVFSDVAIARNSPIHFAETIPVHEDFVFEANTYPWKNEKLVRIAVQLLNENTPFNILPKHITNGIKNVTQNTGFRARFQRLSTSPLTIIDAAHNTDGIKAVLESLKQIQQGTLTVLYGTSSDKNIAEILSLFPHKTQFIFTQFENERTASLEQLKAAAQKNALEGKFFTSSKDALIYAQQIVNKEDTLLITGSFFLISDFF